MNWKLKIGLIIGFLLTCNFSFCQTIIQDLGNDKRIKKDKEMILEISELFQKVTDSLKIDFNHSDTLFIIRGLDIQSRTGYGYVWNNNLKTSYSDNKIWKNHKLVSSNPKIEIKTDKVTWYEFDDLIPIMDKWDTVMIKNYVNECDTVLGGIYWWAIIRLVKSDSMYNIDLIYMKDFGMRRKNKINNDRNAIR